MTEITPAWPPGLVAVAIVVVVAGIAALVLLTRRN
jgi:hypothetical protein